MLGTEIYYGWGTGDDRVEDKGIVIDKNRMTDIVRGAKNELVGISQHDIYLVKREDGAIENVHPRNIIKILNNEKSN